MKFNFKFAYLTVMSLSIMVLSCATKKPFIEPILKPISKLELARQQAAFEHYINGILLIYDNQYPLAEKELTMALKFDPHSLEINYELATLYAQSRRYGMALELRNNITEPDAKFSLLMGRIAAATEQDSLAFYYFKKAVEKDPDDFAARNYLSDFYIQKNLPDSAIAHLRKMREIRPGDLQIQMTLGQIYLEAGQFDSAKASFGEILDHDPSDKAAAAGLAGAYEKSDDPEGALKIYEKMTDLYPEDIIFHSLEINAKLKLGRTQEALNDGLELLRMHPENDELLINVAQLQARNGSFATAESLLTARIETVPDDNSMKLVLADLYIDHDRYEAAGPILKGLIAENDSLSDAYLLLATSYLKQDKSDSAVAALIKAAPLVDNKDALFFQIGRIYQSEKKYDEAKEYYLKARDENPDETGYRIALAEVLDTTGEFERAEKILLDVIHKQPGNPVALNNLGYMYACRGIHLKKAEDFLKRALSIDPENGAYLDSYGWLLFKKGKSEQAIKYIEKALENLGPDSELYIHLGDIYRSRKDYDTSLTYYQKALELSPDDIRIREKIDSLPALGKANTR